MPKLRKSPEAAAQEGFLRALRVGMAERDIPNVKVLSDVTGIPSSTLYAKIKSPRDFTLDQLIRIFRVLEPDPQAVLAFLGYKTKEK